MSQPQYPSQPGPGSPQNPGSAIKFTVQGNALTSNLVPPTLTIDGHPAPTAGGGGSTVIPVPPGPHLLQASSQWLRQYGQASLELVVPPDSLVEVFYAPPFHQFTTGAMGLTEQPRKGLAALVITLAVVLGLVLIVILFSVIAG